MNQGDENYRFIRYQGKTVAEFIDLKEEGIEMKLINRWKQNEMSCLVNQNECFSMHEKCVITEEYGTDHDTVMSSASGI